MSSLNYKVTLILIVCSLTSYAQSSLSKLNLSSQYQINPITDLNVYGLKDQNDQVVIYTSFKLPAAAETVNISFWGANNYEEEVVNLDSLIIKEQYLGEREEYHYYEYILNTQFPLIAVEVMGQEGEESLIEEVFFDPQKLNIALFNNENKLPVVHRWINDRKYYRATDLDLSDLDVFVSHYKNSFPTALPPMSDKRVEEKVIMPDSSFLIFDNNTFLLEKEGFYLFQEDTTSNIGYGWRLEYDAFPKPNNLTQLIPPLIYISTADEYRNLIKNADKKSFDRFWLDIGGSPNIAKSMIRKYYDRVEYANRYFTTYKEGWKTDRGMVYLVYGAPDLVYRDEQEEVWWYTENGEKEYFRFLRFSHVFYPYNYVLLRESNYRNSWFRRVEQLRNNIF